MASESAASTGEGVDKNFASATGNVHEDVSKPPGIFDCEVCHRAFGSMFAYRTHLHNHSIAEKIEAGLMLESAALNAEADDSKPIVIYETGRRFNCEVCFKTFASRFSIRKHMQNHSDEERVECFTEMLEKSYEGIQENPSDDTGRYSCNYCDKTYLSKSALKRHIKGHHVHQEVITKALESSKIDLNPTMYPCDVCGTQFLDNESVEKHKQTSHGVIDVGGKKMVMQYEQGSELGIQAVAIDVLSVEVPEGEPPKENHDSSSRSLDGVQEGGPGLQAPEENPAADDVKMEEVQAEAPSLQPTEEVTDAVQYLCGVCENVFDSRDEITEHIRIEHMSEEEFHMLEEDVVDEEVEYKEADAIPEPKAEIEYVVVMEHPSMSREDGGVVPKMPGDSVESLNDDVVDHTIYEKEAQEESAYLCFACNKIFNTERNLEAHIENDHQDTDRLIGCEICGEEFPLSDQNRIQLHMQSHDSEKSFKCQECHTMFLREYDIVRHKKICGLKALHKSRKSYECETCNQSFSQSSHLQTHMRSHSGDRPYACTMCEKRFLMSSHLKQHIRSHTNERPYKCNMCTKAFLSNSHLKTHIRCHTGEKPHECEICKKRFLQVTHLKTHIVSAHLPKKDWASKYECEVCKKKFVQSSHLKSHMRTHTGERPYNCGLCSKTFANTTHLRSHKCTKASWTKVQNVEVESTNVPTEDEPGFAQNEKYQFAQTLLSNVIYKVDKETRRTVVQSRLLDKLGKSLVASASASRKPAVDDTDEDETSSDDGSSVLNLTDGDETSSEEMDVERYQARKEDDKQVDADPVDKSPEVPDAESASLVTDPGVNQMVTVSDVYGNADSSEPSCFVLLQDVVNNIVGNLELGNSSVGVQSAGGNTQTECEEVDMNSETQN